MRLTEVSVELGEGHELEAERRDREEFARLISVKQELEKLVGEESGTQDNWERLPSHNLRKLCNEIEAILEEWHWKGRGQVEFDEIEFDIVVDGEPRISHGKGVRAILYAAFAIGLLRYCKANGTPHPGFVVIDSPLTSYKKGESVSANDDPVEPGIEAAFWKSLKTVSADVQVIIIENKEPPADVVKTVPYQWFAGDRAQPNDRVAFIPNLQAGAGK